MDHNDLLLDKIGHNDLPWDKMDYNDLLSKCLLKNSDQILRTHYLKLLTAKYVFLL